MITINNSENFLKKLKNLFITSDEPELNVEDKKEDSNDMPLEVPLLFYPNKTDDNGMFSTLQQELAPYLDCISSLEQYQTTTGKNILIKVEKSKFNYPTAKSTTLKTKSNLPIIKSVQSSQETKKITQNIPLRGVCPNQQVIGSYSIERTLANVKLLVDFSVLLYNTIDNNIAICPNDISNLDIYALEDASFVDEPFYFCYTGDCVGLTPYDFSVQINTIQQEVSPVCEFDDYYLYVVGVEIQISYLPPITINTTDTQTLAAINAQLGKPPTNNVFTRGQLASITTLNVANDKNLDFSIFQYLFNLVELNISNTTSDPAKLSQLSVLTRLEILIARNNYIQDYTPFGSLTSLRELYLDNDLASPFRVAAFALQAYDITPLTNLVNLRVLSLSNNNISVIPPQISNLTNLQVLNLSHNQITDITPLTQVPSLITLDLSNNNISQLPSAADLSKLTNLTTLNLNNNSIVDLSNLEGLPKLDNLSIENTPFDPTTLPSNLPITKLNLSSTNLTNNGLTTLNIPSTLQVLNISNNQQTNLTPLSGYNLTINATNQNVNYGTVTPDIDDPTMFILDLSFLRDVDFTTPNIIEISNGGVLVQDQSSLQPVIVWQNITVPTAAYFRFANNSGNFTGRVNVNLGNVGPTV